MNKYVQVMEQARQKRKENELRHAEVLNTRWEALLESARLADFALDRRRARALRPDDVLPAFPLVSIAEAAKMMQRHECNVFARFVSERRLPYWFSEGVYYVPEICVKIACEKIQAGINCIKWDAIRKTFEQTQLEVLPEFKN